jgi:hypothetical protein
MLVSRFALQHGTETVSTDKPSPARVAEGAKLMGPVRRLCLMAWWQIRRGRGLFKSRTRPPDHPRPPALAPSRVDRPWIASGAVANDGPLRRRPAACGGPFSTGTCEVPRSEVLRHPCLNRAGRLTTNVGWGICGRHDTGRVDSGTASWVRGRPQLNPSSAGRLRQAGGSLPRGADRGLAALGLRGGRVRRRALHRRGGRPGASNQEPTMAAGAHFADRGQPDRSIVITSIRDRDRSVATLRGR